MIVTQSSDDIQFIIQRSIEDSNRLCDRNPQSTQKSRVTLEWIQQNIPRIYIGYCGTSYKYRLDFSGVIEDQLIQLHIWIVLDDCDVWINNVVLTENLDLPSIPRICLGTESFHPTIDRWLQLLYQEGS